MRRILLWAALLLAGCASAAQRQPPPEQPAAVVAVPLDSRAAAELSGRGDPSSCTAMMGVMREQAERVSQAYERLERTSDVAAFEREVRGASEAGSELRLADPKLQAIAGRYKAALLGQIEEMRAGKAPLPGQGGLDAETRAIDALIEYCGVNRIPSEHE